MKVWSACCFFLLMFCQSSKAAVWMVTQPWNSEGENLRYFPTAYAARNGGFDEHSRNWIPRIPLARRYSISFFHGFLDSQGSFIPPSLIEPTEQYPEGERVEADRFVALAYSNVGGGSFTALYNDRIEAPDGTESSVLRAHYFTSERKAGVTYDLDYGTYAENDFGSNDRIFNLIHGLDTLPDDARTIPHNTLQLAWNDLNPDHVYGMAADGSGQHLVIYDDNAEMDNKLLYFQSVSDFLTRQNETRYTLAWDPSDHELYGFSYNGQYYNLMFAPDPDHMYPGQVQNTFWWDGTEFTGDTTRFGGQYHSDHSGGAHVRYGDFQHMINDPWPLVRSTDPNSNPDPSIDQRFGYPGSIDWDIMTGYAEDIRGVNIPIPEPSSYVFIAFLCLIFGIRLKRHRSKMSL